MTLNNAVSLVRRAMLWRSLRNRLLVDLGWLGMLFAGLALTDRLAPLVGTPWSLLLLIASAFLLARLVWCARRIQSERTSVLLLADEALDASETLVTADELSRELLLRMRTLHITPRPTSWPPRRRCWPNPVPRLDCGDWAQSGLRPVGCVWPCRCSLGGDAIPARVPANPRFSWKTKPPSHRSRLWQKWWKKPLSLPRLLGKRMLHWPLNSPSPWPKPRTPKIPCVRQRRWRKPVVNSTNGSSRCRPNRML